ncbi:pyridoxamine 5'-phosphate oxidase family protein [Stenotrophomonas sp. YIM B06876]|uniref:pyridoxamine 5'-phosphate oxidase family protein n=1 Tax=Stenotrophomonas sp. YIM B06876 TaxID=3060211 RepID=UPI0027391CC0|nr:pyridoxamine 5'-phosphate oxidase family protein [Stenotrophomonas sp. YIM B06876]
MTDLKDLEHKFWKALHSDRTLMLGLDGVENGHSRPMTAQVEEGARGPIWFFTSRNNALVQHLAQGNQAIAAFSSKSHDLFASIRGTLHLTDDREMVDRLWNAFVAAWYEGGKDDPSLVLLRLDPTEAEIWLNESNLLAGAKMMLGIKPQEDYKDKVGTIDLR